MEQAEFCGIITKAASDLGIVIQMSEVSGHYLFHFGDPQTKIVISGGPCGTKKDALETACKALVEYLKL